MKRTAHTIFRAALIVAAVVLAPRVAPAFAQCETAKLLASDATAEDRFGKSVSISGNVAAVGADLEDDHGLQAGAAYVYRFNGSQWIEEQKLVPADGAAGDWFGCAVSVSGNIAAAGAEQDDDHGTRSGSAYVFRYDGAAWVQEAKLLPSDGAPEDRFGMSIAASGDVVVVGTRYDDDYGPNTGAAYVFRYIGSMWIQEQKLVPTDGGAGDEFGVSVAIDGDTIVVGAQWEDEQDRDAGAVYVFRDDNGTWVREAKLLGSDSTEEDRFGCAVAVSDKTAVIGAVWDWDAAEEAGSAYIFRRDENGTPGDRSDDFWVEERKILASDAAEDDWLGFSVAVSGNTALIAAIWVDDRALNGGAVYVYRYDGSSWIEASKALPSDGTAWDEFGYSVAISGDTGLIGAPFHSDSGQWSGAAYVLDLSRDCCACDLNCDGFVNAADIPYFVLALTDPAEWEAQIGSPRGCDLLCVGDASDDGQFNAGDIPGFVECLTGQ